MISENHKGRKFVLKQNCISTIASQGDFGKCQNPLACGRWDGHTALWTEASFPVTLEEDLLHRSSMVLHQQMNERPPTFENRGITEKAEWVGQASKNREEIWHLLTLWPKGNICLLLMASLQIRLIKILEKKEKRFHLEFLKAASPWKYFKGSSWAKPWSFIQKYKPSGQCIPKKTWTGSHFLVHCQHSLSTKRLIPNRCVGIHPMNAFKGDVCHSFATITQETGKQREWSLEEAPVHLPELGCVAILWE